MKASMELEKIESHDKDRGELSTMIRSPSVHQLSGREGRKVEFFFDVDDNHGGEMFANGKKPIRVRQA